MPNRSTDGLPCMFFHTQKSSTDHEERPYRARVLRALRARTLRLPYVILQGSIVRRQKLCYQEREGKRRADDPLARSSSRRPRPVYTVRRAPPAARSSCVRRDELGVDPVLGEDDVNHLERERGVAAVFHSEARLHSHTAPRFFMLEHDADALVWGAHCPFGKPRHVQSSTARSRNRGLLRLLSTRKGTTTAFAQGQELFKRKAGSISLPTDVSRGEMEPARSRGTKDPRARPSARGRRVLGLRKNLAEEEAVVGAPPDVAAVHVHVPLDAVPAEAGHVART
jgi:hypothetical protein